jgi:hypothetical protein
VDWTATTTVSEDIADISEIKVTHVGQYSVSNITQTAYVYNYSTTSWELFDTAVVGDEYMYPAVKRITSNIANYISTTKQMRIRIRGVGSAGIFYSWSDKLTWEIIPVVTTTETPPIDDSTPSNPVSTGRFNIDGNLSDWAGLTSFGVDGDDINAAGAQVDWLEGWMAHDDQHLYLAYENDGPINTATWWPWAVYLDTDTNTGTGFKINNAMGADYLFDGWSIYRYTGTGTNWSWAYVASNNQSTAQGNFAEAAIVRSDIGNPSKVHAFFVGDNNTFGAQVVDTYPNGWDSFHAYSLGASAPQPSVFSNSFTPTLDSILNDWASVQSFGDDGADISVAGAQADWRSAWMAHDNNNLYLAYENNGVLNNNLRWAWQVFIDTDANVSTGFAVSPAMGASYMVQGNSLYQYTGTGSDWSWTYLASASQSSTSNIAELNFPRNLLGGATNLRVVFRAANWPFTNSYDAEGYDYFPNDSANDSSSYFSYQIQ